ncbi:MAG: ADP-ribose pyrophosphatase [Patescibacteria group bacterium]|jgi:ADP-ribose pyrophosphatase|nr:ADP-ribose pyrophosphatase [Patescibacteria group bacterium]
MSSENWKKIDEKRVYSGFRKMDRKVFQSDEGKVVEFDVKIEGTVACAFAVTTDQNVVLVRQFRPGPERVLLEMPGGHVDEGESHEEAMPREFLEETGYTGDFTYLGESLSCPYSDRIKHNYLVTNCRKIQEPEVHGSEATKVEEMPLEKFRELILTGSLPESDSGFIGLAALDKMQASI